MRRVPPPTNEPQDNAVDELDEAEELESLDDDDDGEDDGMNWIT